MFCFSSVCGTCSCYLLHLILVSGTSYKLLEEDVTTYQEIVIDNAGHRTLLHLPPTPPKPTRKHPQKKDNIQK
jgi:hypothetical protein